MCESRIQPTNLTRKGFSEALVVSPHRIDLRYKAGQGPENSRLMFRPTFVQSALPTHFIISNSAIAAPNKASEQLQAASTQL